MAQNNKPLTLLVIVGMPGSGKTTYAKQLVNRKLLDGFNDDYEYGPINELDPKHRPEDEELIEALKAGKKWAIADTRYCDPRERFKLQNALMMQFPNLRVKYEYFENNTQSCEHNARVRKRGELPRHEINLMYYYSDLYEIPAGAKTLKIVRA